LFPGLPLSPRYLRQLAPGQRREPLTAVSSSSGRSQPAPPRVFHRLPVTVPSPRSLTPPASSAFSQFLTAWHASSTEVVTSTGRSPRPAAISTTRALRPGEAPGSTQARSTSDL